ncbi:hypothetical protein HRbin40_02515 [bacterium HR40]|nr:hypothetical protein HRbin40_02515 [bacterium HR40]
MGGVAALCDRLAFALFLALLVWAPVPYASNRPWAWAPLAALLGLALLLEALALLLARERLRLPPTVALAGLAFALAIGWGWLQGTPGLLPQEWAHPLWAEVATTGLPVEPVVGLSGENAHDNAMRLLAYAAAFALAFLFARHRRRARTIFATILGVVGLEAAYGLLNHFAGWDTVLWEPGPKAYAGFVTGTFVNRNNFATYLNLGLLVGLALLLEELLRATSGEELRRLVIALFERILGRRGLLLVLLLAIATATLLTGSRGGFLSLAVAFLLFLLLGFLVTRPRRSRALAAILATLLLVSGLLAVSGGVVWERLLATDETGGSRTLVYALALDMMAERPWLGHGLGSFEQAFFLHRDERFGVVFDKAHNTYLEHAVELGLPATVLLYLGPLLLFGRVCRGVFRRRRDQIFPLVATTATVLVGLHALVDFSLQMPAVAVTYAAILGVGVAQAEGQRSRRSSSGRAAWPSGEEEAAAIG